MGTIHVHVFMTLDGVVDAPVWTMDFGFDPAMGEAIGGAMASCTALLLGRTTYEMFAQSWPQRTVEDDPVQALLADGLVDVLNLVVYPTTRGGGPRLFADASSPAAYALSRHEAYDNGVLFLQYRPA